MTPLERLGRAINDAGYSWTDEMVSAYTEAIETLCTPLNGDQVIALWQQSNGHAMRFAALIESFHGMIPKIFSGDQK